MPKKSLEEQQYEFTVEQMRKFQDLFIHAREGLGKSQVAVAEETGLTQTWISAVERATYPSFNAVDLFKLCKYYGIMPNQIANILGFLQSAEEFNDDEMGAVAGFQQMFHALSPENQHLAIVLVRQLLIGIREYDEKQK